MTSPSTAISKKNPKLLQAQILDAKLKVLGPRMADVLPKHITPERMLRLTLLAFNRQPELQKCSIESIAESALVVAGWGLEIGRTAHLVPFYDKDAKVHKAVAIADYKGKIELMMKAGFVRNIDARLVTEADEFFVEYGLNQKLIHRPKFKVGARVIGAYAIARLTAGGETFEFMTIDELEGVRKISKQADKGPWLKNTGEMQKKTVVHRLAKRLPWSAELTQAIENEQLADTYDDDAPLPQTIPGTQISVTAGGEQAPVAEGELGGEDVTDKQIADDDKRREATRK